MNTPTTGQQELQLQETLSQWQNRQQVHGNIFLFLCLWSFISFALFCLDPGPSTTWLLVVSLMLMVSAGASMFRAAHAVVQHKQLLQLPVSATHSQETHGLPAAAYYGKGTGSADSSAGWTRPWMFPGTQN